MNNLARWSAIAVMVAAMAVICGCPSGTEPPAQQPAPPPVQIPVAPAEESAEKAPTEVVIEPEPVATTMPKIEMTDSLRATCLVGEGDQLPDGQVKDLEGNSHSIRSLLGDSATVVFFFTRGQTRPANLAAQAALHDLQKDIAEPYADQGVKVLAVNEIDAVGQVAELAAAAEVTFPVLTDRGGGYFASIATEKLPRVYLVDPEGKIFWFDIGYSETMRRSLKEALQVALGE